MSGHNTGKQNLEDLVSCMNLNWELGTKAEEVAQIIIKRINEVRVRAAQKPAIDPLRVFE